MSINHKAIYFLYLVVFNILFLEQGFSLDTNIEKSDQWGENPHWKFQGLWYHIP